jgi:hypothetical protein
MSRHRIRLLFLFRYTIISSFSAMTSEIAAVGFEAAHRLEQGAEDAARTGRITQSAAQESAQGVARAAL